MPCSGALTALVGKHFYLHTKVTDIENKKAFFFLLATESNNTSECNFEVQDFKSSFPTCKFAFSLHDIERNEFFTNF